MSCGEVRQWILRPGGIEGGTAREHEAADRHLDDCDACTAFRRERDPLQRFRSLAEDAPPPDFWIGFWDGIRGGLQETGRLGPRESLALLRPAYRLAMAVAVVAAAGVLAFTTLNRIAPEAPATMGMEHLPAPAVEPASVATVESIGSTQARITEVKVFGAQGDVTEVVLIFDEGIDL